jgi:poly(hydroxyalkanoate) granule-associated protein
MATKGDPRGAGSAFDSEFGKSVADSAQRIWLAGLGAFERAREEGPRVFDALVEQGQQMNERARGTAEEALRTVRDGATAAGGTFGRLEQAIEERIVRTLGRMGVMTRAEVNDLSAQVNQLAEEMRGLMGGAARPTGGQRASGKRPANKPTRRAKGAATAGKKRRARHR